MVGTIIEIRNACAFAIRTLRQGSFICLSSYGVWDWVMDKGGFAPVFLNLQWIFRWTPSLAPILRRVYDIGFHLSLYVWSGYSQVIFFYHMYHGKSQD